MLVVVACIVVLREKFHQEFIHGDNIKGRKWKFVKNFEM